MRKVKHCTVHDGDMINYRGYHLLNTYYVLELISTLYEFNSHNSPMIAGHNIFILRMRKLSHEEIT